MNILQLSSKIKQAVDTGRNKQGVIADALAKVFGYDSHHQVQGNIKLVTDTQAAPDQVSTTSQTVYALNIRENDCTSLSTTVHASMEAALLCLREELKTHLDELDMEGEFLERAGIDCSQFGTDKNKVVAKAHAIIDTYNELELSDVYSWSVNGGFATISPTTLNLSAKLAVKTEDEAPANIFKDLRKADSISIDDYTFRYFDESNIDESKPDDEEILSVECEDGGRFDFTTAQLKAARKVGKTWFLPDPEDENNEFLLTCSRVIDY